MECIALAKSSDVAFRAAANNLMLGNFLIAFAVTSLFGKMMAGMQLEACMSVAFTGVTETLWAHQLLHYAGRVSFDTGSAVRLKHMPGLLFSYEAASMVTEVPARRTAMTAAAQSCLTVMLDALKVVT